MAGNDIEKLIEIMAQLRHPTDGCPWDLQQTYKSIVPYTIEEAHEVAETIEENDLAALKDELGDLLFQVIFYARLAEEDGLFDFDAIVDAICRKMIRRHPHVFGEDRGKTAEEVKGQWERIKAEEKQNGSSAGAVEESILDGVPASLPALSRAIKLQNKAARVGFDWPSLTPVFDKAQEEFAELQHEIEQDAERDRIEDEFGDVLFVMANVGRHLKIDPEQALRRANAKFIRRFGFIEQELAQQGRRPEDTTLDEMEAIWRQAKQAEKARDDAA